MHRRVIMVLTLEAGLIWDRICTGSDLIIGMILVDTEGMDMVMVCMLTKGVRSSRMVLGELDQSRLPGLLLMILEGRSVSLLQGRINQRRLRGRFLRRIRSKMQRAGFRSLGLSFWRKAVARAQWMFFARYPRKISFFPASFMLHII